mmetsp:Transcript_26838/g.25713  ORF Transcript_26838/g.25713 Transcript_26838/m.25713 type:complete len:496 (-) Transcript_26838:313-1800(-)
MMMTTGTSSENNNTELSSPNAGTLPTSVEHTEDSDLTKIVNELVEHYIKLVEEVKSLEEKTESLEEEVKLLRHQSSLNKQSYDLASDDGVEERKEESLAVGILEEGNMEEGRLQEAPKDSNTPSIITSRNSNQDDSIDDDHQKPVATVDGIHGFIEYMMTKKDSTETTKCLSHHVVMFLLPLLSWIVILAQCLVLHTLMVFPQCKISRGRSIAGDCDALEQICVDDLYLPDGIGSCRVEDGYRKDCPFLEGMVMPWSSKFVIVFVFFYIVAGVLHDKEQNSRTTQAARQRASNNKNNRWVTFNIWLIHILRSYVLPASTFYAAIIVLYVNGDFRPSEVLLNGIAVGVICSFDDLLLSVFISDTTQRRVAKEMGDAQDQYPLQESNKRKMWWMQRLHCFAMMAISVLCVFYPVFMIKKIPISHLNGSFGREYVSCDDFQLVGYPIYFITSLLILFDQLSIQSTWRVVLREFLLVTLLLFIFEYSLIKIVELMSFMF